VIVFKNIARVLAFATPCQRAIVAFFAGSLSALAMAPIGAWPILLITFPVLVWLVDGCTGDRWNASRQAAGIGWCFGFGYFIFGLYWIGYAFLVDAKTFGWLLPVAIVGLPAYLALYTAFGLAAARFIWTRGPLRILALASMVTLAEWLRGHLLSGFPWNAFGYALTSPLVLAQSVSLFGIWGLTFVTIAVCASPAVFADSKKDTRHPYQAALISGAVLLALVSYGAFRLWNHPTEYVRGVKLRIMQPNLQQDEKFNYSAKDRVMARYLELSRAKASASTDEDITFLIWPEAAFPFFLTHEPTALSQIAELLKPNTQLITGAVRNADAVTVSHVTRVYNSLYVIDANGSIRSVYDKMHLVPFGEYLPFQQLLENLGLQQLTKQIGGFIAGAQRHAIPLTHAPPVLPLICYETIFADSAMPAHERPGWIVNVTNDGWFGISSGPYQHLQQARLLAIAEGLPLVRAANTGISAIIDPVGRITIQLPLAAKSVFDSGLPRELQPTIYAEFGDVPILLLGTISLIALTRKRRLVN
jgi:apolipoprotein N-acyltransferase